ncbi:bifunctional UDP-N-acetylglucosamine diphosphorylase/glucosamine-1-phosphate N-acetyltransferase GlmU [Nocardioides pocheonensis]|uniref:Bifunctional protein GlmU n=1 Tax=Nocardioides pocheonensis TaxID=661485 RepID=A0A3N0GHF5_9ACTN|nr:bifunctional UDP-N-acetylglucosamine diphosphorylase/glucosamine-1-phosphate N-acetyltransferase GlmU [Nocardioides pocheonensis]RNM11636.1 bifunctional UDP-N-acetylglucosamine diphosphorylase/glucosamine-1-phosphate N-acetyltransferase GlmU [Nocardioides pocheonensis]
MSDDVTVIVLAAGGGTRMKSKTMKVLHPIAGRSMIGHVLHAARQLEPTRIVAVVGHQREQVGAHIEDIVPDAVMAVQDTQEGTAHAVRTAWEAIPAEARVGTVVVAYGDTPLLEGETLARFVRFHRESPVAMSILTGVVADPTGYGRILRDEQDAVAAIVEEKDATPEQAAIDEINSGILAFDADFLDDVLPRIGNDNAKGEYYLTDAVALAREAGRTVAAFAIDDVMQTEGANDRVQLAALGAEMNRRILEHWMREGVTIVDPATTWVDADVRLAADVTLLPGVQLQGATVVDEDAVVGPDCTLKDVEVGAGARVVRTHAELAVIGAGATVGPFAYLRPRTVLGADGKIGAFVETKNSEIGPGAKVPHLSYVGDATIGEGANIGAGTIFANYDGLEKHRTTIGAHAKTASNNTFVAPVTVGDGAATGAGSVIRRDVPPGALAVSSGPQRHYEAWALRKRAGTKQAEAAEKALGEPGERPDGGTPDPDVGDAPVGG